MQPVVQEEISGCGIASVAALAGKSYQEAKAAANALGIYAEDTALWSDTRYVRTLLRHYGIKIRATETPFTSWEALPDKALLSIKWRNQKEKAFWHWVVFLRTADDPVVLDPKKALKHHIRTDFGRMKPKWHIAVS